MVFKNGLVLLDATGKGDKSKTILYNTISSSESLTIGLSQYKDVCFTPKACFDRANA